MQCAGSGRGDRLRGRGQCEAGDRPAPPKGADSGPGGSRFRSWSRGMDVLSPTFQVIQEHNVEQEIIQAEDDFKIIEHADIAMDDNLGRTMFT